MVPTCNRSAVDGVQWGMGRDAASDAAFSEFAIASQGRLRSTAYLLCGDWDRASDHVQEGLIRVYVAWPRLVRHGGELAYARKAVVSAFLDSSRKRSSTERSTSQHPDRASGEDLAACVADRAALMAGLARLPGRQRACVVLRYFEELDVRETATALGCSEGNVKSQTSRALASLRAMFEDASRDELVVAGERNLPW
jgi:RNA polymerase sigma-70 factor (sigma-E family)